MKSCVYKILPFINLDGKTLMKRCLGWEIFRVLHIKMK